MGDSWDTTDKLEENTYSLAALNYMKKQMEVYGYAQHIGTVNHGQYLNPELNQPRDRAYAYGSDFNPWNFLLGAFRYTPSSNNNNFYHNVYATEAHVGLGMASAEGQVVKVPVDVQVQGDGAVLLTLGNSIGGNPCINNPCKIRFNYINCEVVNYFTVKCSGSRRAVCQFKGDGNGLVTGLVQISQKSGEASATFNLNLAGLTAGKHGFHVHEKGDLNNNCKGAGGHFNPFKKSHSSPNSVERHVGDLGNVVADAAGNVVTQIKDSQATLRGDVNILGKALVIHEGEDDVGQGGNSGSLVTGNAGARAGCCIIQNAK